MALHGVRRSRLRVGDVACVVGCGPIGLLTVQCARIAGAGHVVAVEPDAGRRERALALGADSAFAPGPELREHLNELTGGLRADIAFDCAGVPQTLQQALDMVRRAARCACWACRAASRRSCRCAGWGRRCPLDTSFVFTLEEMGIAAGLIADGRLKVAELDDGTITLDQLGQTIDDLATRRSTAVKVLVDPTAG